jgi:multisubunit Na+/H+ antiporter MnhE subunit
MKSWQRHFILGIVMGTISITLIRALLTSIPNYTNDSNLIILVFVIVSYGVCTAVLGEILVAFGPKK